MSRNARKPKPADAKCAEKNAKADRVALSEKVILRETPFLEKKGASPNPFRKPEKPFHIYRPRLSGAAGVLCYGRGGAVISVRNGLGNRTSGGRTRGKRGRQRGNGTCGGRRRIRIPQPQALCSIIPIYSFSCSPHLRENPALILYIIISVRSDKVKYPDKRAGRPCDTAHVRIFAAVPTSFIRTAAAKPSARKQRVIRRRFCALRHSPMKS